MRSNNEILEDLFSIVSIKDIDITGLDISKIWTLAEAFSDTDFNQDISSWDVSNVKDMNGMFRDNKRFKQDLSNWDISKLDNVLFMFKGSLITMDDLKSWGWLDQRPDLDWETAF